MKYSHVALFFLFLNQVYAVADIKPEIYVKKLTVNLKDTYRLVSRKSEREGVEDLKKLVVESKFEELYAYIPSISTWYEIGYGAHTEQIDHQDEKKSAILDGIHEDYDYLDSLYKKFNDVVIYHFHPRSDSPQENELMQNIMDVRDTRPSPGDVTQAFLDSQHFYNFWRFKSHVKGSIRFRLVSYLGITEYALNPLVIEEVVGYALNPLMLESMKGYTGAFLSDEADWIYYTGEKRYFKDRQSRINAGQEEFKPKLEAYYMNLYLNGRFLINQFMIDFK